MSRITSRDRISGSESLIILAPCLLSTFIEQKRVGLLTLSVGNIMVSLSLKLSASVIHR